MTRFERYATMASVLIGAGGLGLAALQFAEPGPGAAPIPLEVTVKQAEAPKEEPKLARIMVLRTIGRSVDYIESIVGKPVTLHDIGNKRSWRQYEVDNCELSIIVDQAKSVSSISLDVGSQCSFSWSDMDINLRGLPEPNQITFGQFFRDPYTLIGARGCVWSCGNAGEPEITLTAVSGGRATNWVTTRVSMIVDSDREFGASAKLADVIRVTISEDAAYNLGAGCDNRVPSLALKHFRDLRIERVEFVGESDLVLEREARPCSPR